MSSVINASTWPWWSTSSTWHKHEAIEGVLQEQIVSDIENEHDIDEEDGVRDLGDDVYMVKATLAIEDFNEGRWTKIR